MIVEYIVRVAAGLPNTRGGRRLRLAETTAARCVRECRGLVEGCGWVDWARGRAQVRGKSVEKR